MSNLRKYENKNPFSREENKNPFSRNENSSNVAYSGNSDVDVIVEVNTMPIAYAMLCSLRATKQISEFEFEDAVRKLKKLVDEDRSYNHNDPKTAKIYHLE
ncbi:hypothetical protein [Terribacillus sp. 7520-G]|uniref:hypothetical protein n=1 Tax=Terribacillus TaxID=459532 RepID=UPI000BA765E1|nr:hypothetical protein [Terribacillus sp. 7520-G]PAD38571.1 hypothetical protein CHH53_10075 [Terribacillus sp. 7520-G]